MRKDLTNILVINLLFLFVIAGCKRNPPITKIGLVTNVNYSNYPDVALEIDSSLHYKFWGGGCATKRGFLEGKISKTFWDTIQARFTKAKYWNFKNSYEETCNGHCDIIVPPLSIRAIIHYGDSAKHIFIEILPGDFLAPFLFLMNTYENVDLKPLPPDEKLSFETGLPWKATHRSEYLDTNIVDTGIVYNYVKQVPTFTEGSINDYLSKKMNYPEKAMKDSIKAIVYAAFTIERDGSVSNIKILKNTSTLADFEKEVIRVLSAMPKWNPGKLHDTAVRVQLIVPVNFTLK